MNNKYTHSVVFSCLLGLLSITLSGCQGNISQYTSLYTGELLEEENQAILPSFTSLYQEKQLKGENWAVLPFISHINIPDDVSIQLDRMLLVQLPSAGVDKPMVYKKPENHTAPDYLTRIYELERAQLWAINEQISHAISGEILEWQYDSQNRFSTMLSLKIMDISSGEMVWSMNGLGEGSPGESAYDVSRKLIVDLLAAMPVYQPQQEKESNN